MLICKDGPISFDIKDYPNNTLLQEDEDGNKFYSVILNDQEFIAVDWAKKVNAMLTFYRVFEDNPDLPEAMPYTEPEWGVDNANILFEDFTVDTDPLHNTQYTGRDGNRDGGRKTREQILEDASWIDKGSFRVGFEDAHDVHTYGYCLNVLNEAIDSGDDAAIEKERNVLSNFLKASGPAITIYRKADFLMLTQTEGFNFKGASIEAENSEGSYIDLIEPDTAYTQFNNLLKTLKRHNFTYGEGDSRGFEWNDLDNHSIYLGEFGEYEGIFMNGQNDSYAFFIKEGHIQGYQCANHIYHGPSGQVESLVEYLDEDAGTLDLREYLRENEWEPSPFYIGNNLDKGDSFVKILEMDTKEFLYLDANYDMALFELGLTLENLKEAGYALSKHQKDNEIGLR